MRHHPLPWLSLLSVPVLTVLGAGSAFAGNPTARPLSPTADPSRQAAQRGINYLAKATAAWAKEHQCYGCHVQAVTLEALSVGKHNQYDVPRAEFATIKDSILNHSGGARGPQGLHHSGYPLTARTFGSLALARYDQLVDDELRDDLARAARQLLPQQQKDGSVRGDHTSDPVTVGTMQATYQAMQTWRQAYARSADPIWLTPVQKAEQYIQNTSAHWDALGGAVGVQDINYALLGLMAAGVSPSEDTAARLIRHLRKNQNADGGWALSGSGSVAYATGQTVYALRTAGVSQQDAAVQRGMNWLVAHQQQDGSWGSAGSGKAEAMWAVLGMVSVDVMGFAISGIADGQRLGDQATLNASAKDNSGQRVVSMAVFLDDVKLTETRADKLSFRLDARKLAEGPHLLDVVATNNKGQSSHRRLTVYAGDVFLSQLASRFEGGATHLTFRTLMQPGEKGTVRVRVRALGGANGTHDGKVVFEQALPATAGAMAMAWAGKNVAGKAQPAGRYAAEVAFVDARGKVRQAQDAVFYQDTEEAQRQRFGQVQGRLNMRASAGAGRGTAANTRVDLVDEDGHVVQSTVSTEAGEYRFKNVDKGKYKVRVSKKGFANAEAPVEAAPAQEAKASVDLH